jgi:hypothetical protein
MWDFSSKKLAFQLADQMIIYSRAMYSSNAGKLSFLILFTRKTVGDFSSRRDGDRSCTYAAEAFQTLHQYAYISCFL